MIKSVVEYIESLKSIKNNTSFKQQKELSLKQKEQLQSYLEYYYAKQTIKDK